MGNTPRTVVTVEDDGGQVLRTSDLKEAAVFQTAGYPILGIEVQADQERDGSTRRRTVFVFRGENLDNVRLAFLNRQLTCNATYLLENFAMLKTMSHNKLRPQDRTQPTR